MNDHNPPGLTETEEDDPNAPVWKRDFPYEAISEEEVTRREFARYLLAGAGTIAVANVGIAVWTQMRTINTGEPRAIVASDAVAVGEPYLFSYPTSEDPAVLLRLSDEDGDVVAFSQKCTHLGCVVYYEAEESRWHCPCHEGNFEVRTGDVISGPPTRPLWRIELEVRDDGVIWAMGQAQ